MSAFNPLRIPKSAVAGADCYADLFRAVRFFFNAVFTHDQPISRRVRFLDLFAAGKK